MAIQNNATGVREVLFPISSGNYLVIQALLDDIPNAEILEPFIFRYYNKTQSRWLNLTMDLTPVGNDNYMVCRVLKTAWSDRDANDAIITGVWGAGQVLQVTNNIANTTETHSLTDNSANITITGSLTNYRFFGDVVANYTDVNGINKNINLTVSVNEGISTANIILSDIDVNFVVTITGIYQQFADITNNVTGTELTYRAISHDLRVTLIGNNVLYRFTEIPVITYTDTAGETKTQRFTVSVVDGISTAEVYLTDAQTPQTAYVNGKYEQFINLKNNIANTHETATAQGYILNISVVGSLPNYMFIDNPVLSYTDETGNIKTAVFSVSVVDGVSTANISVSDCDTTQEININGTYDKFVNVSKIAVNCEVLDVPQFVNRNSVLTLTAQALNYFTFETAPKIKFQYVGRDTEVNFDVSQDKSAANISVSVSDYDFDNLTEIIINADATINTEYVNRYGTINLYRVTEQNLKDFSKLRFVTTQHGDNVQYLDYGDYIVSIKRIYANCGVMLPNVLKVGNYDTGIQAETPLTDIITLNCGSVAIPVFSNDNLDYNSEINIYLPFIGFRPLKSDYINKNISVDYKVNLISCDAVCNLSCEGIIFDSINCNISSEIYFKLSSKGILTGDTKNFGKADFNVGMLQDLTPYIVVKYFTNENSKIYNSECMRTELKNITGYAEVTEITNFISDTITDTEKDMLLSLLKNGVTFAPSTL